MIRTLKRLIATDNNDNKEYVEIACLSTDSKPTTGIITGSVIYEVDTGKRYEFNEAASTWVEQPASGSGSGGERVEIALTQQYNSSTGKYEFVNSEYTFQDVYDMLAAKKDVVLVWGDVYLYATKYKQSQYGNHAIDLDFIGFFRYPMQVGYEIDANVAYVSNVSPTGTLTLNGDTYLAIYNPGATVQLVQDGSNLVAQSGMDNLKPDTKYYVGSNTAALKNVHWYSTVSYYFSFMEYTYDIIIKDEVTGDLYRSTGGTTFTPYTP